jgi:hypothetical protein
MTSTTTTHNDVDDWLRQSALRGTRTGDEDEVMVRHDLCRWQSLRKASVLCDDEDDDDEARGRGSAFIDL